MAALGDVATTKEIAPNAGVKFLQIFLDDASADDGDTFTVDLTKYGCTNLMGIIGWQHATEGSVITTEAPTTEVTAGVLTVTIGGGDDNKKRSFMALVY